MYYLYENVPLCTNAVRSTNSRVAQLGERIGLIIQGSSVQITLLLLFFSW